MKISLIRKDKQNITHLSTKTLEDFIDRIKVDTKTREVERYREFIQRTGSTLGYTRKDKVVEAYPMVELRAESNGTLVPASHNGVVVLHVSGLHVARDFAAVKAVARMLPMTLAAFEGADGQSMELLVSIGQSNGQLPADEAGLASFYKAGYDVAFRIYGSVLPKAIERRAADAMSHFPMTLDSEPYFNAQATPICVDAQIAATMTATGDAPLATVMPQPTDAAEAPAEQEEISQETKQLIDFLTTRYVFRYNTVMGYTEYRHKNGWATDWQVADENAINGMTIEARLAGLSTRDKDVRRYVRSNLIRHFNPTEDYLWPLYGHWDKRTDYIAQLARTVPCDLPQWEGWFRKWFLYMVAQWLGRTRNYGNAVAPLLVSKQGDNKSTFCRSLLPDALQWGFTDSLNVSDKRQTLQAMHSFLLINLDEFNQIPARIQQGFLKNVIQLPRVKIKRPYGRHVEDFPRRASFIATTNEATVLADPTGNRRFIGVRLTGPIDVSRRPNYEQLYAQAVEAVVDGEQYWFDEQEVKDIMAHNRQFEITPPAVLYFNEYYDVAASEEENGEWLSPTAIYQRLRRAVGAGLQANGVTRFGRYLANIPGLQQRRVGNSKQYLVRAKQ